MNIDVKRAMLEFSFGRPITIEGIGLGSKARDIPYEGIVSSSPNTSSELVEQNGEFIRTLENGSEVHLSDQECYQLVIEGGGWLFSEHITWKVENQLVQWYLIKGALLDKFNITAEEQIIERFGRPECLSVNGIGMEYNYMSRKLRMLWSKNESRLYSVDVGDFTVPMEVREEDAKNGVFHIGGIRRVRITSLKQSDTYGGLISGFPTEKINDRIIAEVKASAIKQSTTHGDVHLLAPKRTPRPDREPYAFGAPETIPAITCVAELTSAFPAKDFEASNSSVILVWFQSKMAMPIDREVVEEIELLNWPEISTDYSD